MVKLEYNMKIWEKKRRAAQWQLTGGIFALAGLLATWMQRTVFDSSTSFSYLPLAFLGAIFLSVCVASLSAWSNYSFLYYYFKTDWIGSSKPEELELSTGMIESIHSITMPYAGSFKELTIRLQDQSQISLFVKGKQLKKIDPSQPIRVLSYHMFIYHISQ